MRVDEVWGIKLNNRQVNKALLVLQWNVFALMQEEEKQQLLILELFVGYNLPLCYFHGVLSNTLTWWSKSGVNLYEEILHLETIYFYFYQTESNDATETLFMLCLPVNSPTWIHAVKLNLINFEVKSHGNYVCNRIPNVLFVAVPQLGPSHNYLTESMILFPLPFSHDKIWK